MAVSADGIRTKIYARSAALRARSRSEESLKLGRIGCINPLFPVGRLVSGVGRIKYYAICAIYTEISVFISGYACTVAP